MMIPLSKHDIWMNKNFLITNPQDFQVKTEKGQETPARTGLGSTTVLAVVTVGFGFSGRTRNPTSGWVTGWISVK